MRQKLKILYPIGTYYPSQEGGPSNSVYWMCSGLKQYENIETIVVTTKGGIDQEKTKLDLWHIYGNNKVIYTNSQGLFPFKMLLESIKQLSGTDVLHLTSLFYPPSIVLLLFNFLFYRKKVVVSVRGELDDYALKNYKPKLKNVLLSVWRTFKLKIYFHCTVEEEKSFTINAIGKTAKTIVLPNFILFEDKLKSHNLINNHKYILFLGRLHPKKGIENLIEALPQSHSFIESDFKLKIAGEGHPYYQNSLKQLVLDLKLEDKTEFLGHVEGDEKTTLLQNAFFLIMPSHTENFGNVVVEALINSTPVIASKGTPWKILEEYNCGFWIENDSRSLSQSIDRALNITPKTYKELTKNAVTLANKEFNIDYNYHKWVDFYESL